MQFSVRSKPSLVILLSMLSTGPLAGQTHRAAAAPQVSVVGFGTSIVISGDRLYVGRPGELAAFPMPPMQDGAVYVFARAADGSWTQQSVVTTADTRIGDGFGRALAASGNVLLVAVPGQDNARGGVYAFERGTTGQWSQAGHLVPSEAVSGDEVGFSVTLHEGLALVGAPGRDEARGAVYAFRRDPTTGRWAEVSKFAGSSAVPGDRFGAAVALDPTTALIGAPGPHTVPPLVGAPPPYKPGSAYVFRHDGGDAWREASRLVSADSTVLSLGISVRLERGGALVGAPMASRGVGAVYHFQPDSRSGAWQESGRLVPEPAAPGFFGYIVAGGGPDLLVGAPVAGGLAGAIYVFRHNEATSQWEQSQRIAVSELTMGASFGGAIAARGDLAVIGAPGGDFFEGTGYLYTRNPATGEWHASGTLVDESPGLDAIVGEQVQCEDGTARLFFCSEVDLVSFLPVGDIGGERGIQVNDVWGWTDATTGKEYAIVGRFDATTFIDVSDPARPVYLGELPLHEGARRNLWRDIKVYRNHAFIVSDGAGPHGVQIFDLTQLRAVQDPPVTFRETAHYDRVHSAHNIVINEATGFAYVVGASMGGETCGGGLHMIDIRDPANPTFVGCFADVQTGRARTGYSHDAMCVVYNGPDADHQGKEICFGANETALSIADVTDKANPIALAAAAYPNAVYAHQGWIAEDHRHFFLNDEGDEIAGVTPRTRTLVWDIVDLDDPILLTEYLGETSATDHNLYVRGPYLYESNYVAGLRIIDVRDPANPREVGFFDTVPFGPDAPGFSGSWSNYPFFESGNIIVTSMREGVFILRKRPQRLMP
jgi:choice-of-anchor B domain-containing protein